MMTFKPEADVNVISPHLQILSFLLSLNRLSGLPLRFTYFHVYPTISESEQTCAPVMLRLEYDIFISS